MGSHEGYCTGADMLLTAPERVVGLFYPTREPELGRSATDWLLERTNFTYELRSNPEAADGCDAVLVMLPHEGEPPDAWQEALMGGPRHTVQVHPSPRAPRIVPLIYRVTSMTEAMSIINRGLT